jgi:hypothetical protein
MRKKMGKTLSALLWDLSKNIIAKVKEYQTEGGLTQIRTLYVKPKVEDFEYEDGLISHGVSWTHVEKEEWHWKDQYDFIHKVVEHIPEHSDCIAEISKKYKIPKRQAEYWLSRFVQILADKAVDPLSDEFIVDQVTTFIRDLDKSPRDWRIKVWLDGIWLEEEQCELASEMILRRPNPADLEIERPFEMFPYGTFTFPQMPSSVLEFGFRAKDPNQVRKEIELILDVLRLFRLGSINASRTEMFPQSIVNSAATLGSAPVAIHYQYAFQSADVGPLMSLIKKIKPILPSSFDTPIDGVDPLGIAFQRYKDALHQRGTIESRITSAITCLESLYLKARERMELSHRLSQRVSALLRFFEFIPLKVYNDVSRAYEIRSTFIHGSQIEKRQQKSAPALCETILEYARVSLLVFFQLKDTAGKEELINKLDNSLLEEKALQKTKELIGKDIIITR